MTEQQFFELYDAAMDARQEIAKALETVPYSNSGVDHCLLHVGDTVNFCAHIIGRSSLFGGDIYEKAVDYGRHADATVEAIKACTARAIAALKNKTREGRIAELRDELRKLEEGE